MGKTVPTYRLALEYEIKTWKRFRNALPHQEQEAFDELMDMCRNNAMASGNACNPIIFEPMTMSILLSQQKHLLKLEQQLHQLICQETARETVDRY
jgi:hypothetical protein